MSRSDDGEFELVLGNKQLLSLFFLVVVLFAVFFSLGYLVGKSVSPAQTLAAQPPATVNTPASVMPALPPLPEPTSAPSAGLPPPAVVETQPARSEPVTDTTAPRSQPADAVLTRELHLQIAAVRVREDAEALVESLHRKGYKVTLNSQAGDGWYRILLGPFASEHAAQDMKAQLERDGYKSILKRP